MKKIIKSDRLAEPVGPFSAGTGFERLIFASGQVGQLPESGQLAGDDLESQARQALKNLLAVIEAGGGNRDTVLKVNCWLLTMNDFAAFNAIYKEFFDNEGFPARTCIAAAELPLGAKVEVEAIAHRMN
ncbi:TPA: RidA family protein [Klebsiella pneumoniae]|jgi:2-iminobutanoate/2-iminopropanoate deaminase|nr:MULTISPECIES: RidA family protein [Enterobacteriaceae]HBQ6198024.1 RidA family protein [Klebsiella variicola subsp. variicola]KEY49059.1 regulator [Citrobacter amalonaticus]MBA6167580.1 RidA family protein [Klebsiella variicola]MBA6183300.1 RidA family protein [Klebsiella variicola]MCJ3091646.1 RidA family protein [Klebsiella quasipneumoniae]